jgi:hypothetical protein
MAALEQPPCRGRARAISRASLAWRLSRTVAGLSWTGAGDALFVDGEDLVVALDVTREAQAGLPRTCRPGRREGETERDASAALRRNSTSDAHVPDGSSTS